MASSNANSNAIGHSQQRAPSPSIANKKPASYKGDSLSNSVTTGSGNRSQSHKNERGSNRPTAANHDP